MKKIICKIEYDTEKSEVIAKHTGGNIGDDDGFEEVLYKTPEGKLSLYVNGGPTSIHPEENIIRTSAAKADEWRKEKLGE